MVNSNYLVVGRVLFPQGVMMTKDKTTRISQELARRIEAHKIELMRREKRRISFIEASRHYAKTSVTNLDKFDEGVKRIRKLWKW